MNASCQPKPLEFIGADWPDADRMLAAWASQAITPWILAVSLCSGVTRLKFNFSLFPFLLPSLNPSAPLFYSDPVYLFGKKFFLFPICRLGRIVKVKVKNKFVSAIPSWHPDALGH